MKTGAAMASGDNSQFMGSSFIGRPKSGDSVYNFPLSKTEKRISSHFNKLFRELYIWQQKAPSVDDE